MRIRGSILKKIIAAFMLLFVAVPGVAHAAMGITAYGNLISGDNNPFIKDTAKTYAFVGWASSSAAGGTKVIRDNKVTVKSVIYWKNKKGKSKNTQVTKTLKNVAGKTSTVSAKSGNDKSTALSYHYACVKDNLSKKTYRDELYLSE